jgi:transposase-like protein
MFRSLPKRAIAWLVGVLGPSPSPPRRYFSKAWDERVRQRGEFTLNAKYPDGIPALSKARLVLTAVIVEKRPVAEVARTYGVARSWVYALVDRYQAEGEAAFEPRSRRPKTSPNAISQDTVQLIRRLPKELAGQGLNTGPHTIAWHLEHHHQGPGLGGHRQPVPVPRGTGHPRPGQAAEVVLPAVRRRAAQRVLAVRLHPLPGGT